MKSLSARIAARPAQPRPMRFPAADPVERPGKPLKIDTKKIEKRM
jgi:hypothetical protein